MTEDERLAWLDVAEYRELAALFRSEPKDSPWFKGRVCDAFSLRYAELQRLYNLGKQRNYNVSRVR